ncbi:LLM class flavin-dependent oxidoreductase [Actinomadura sp. SCN-SB]|uniref:LLM class flavin-dependent oxidoreductase n=1 Tax=Actinomadura sp. SCN-SB TaxID=3373092 RepID=UPI003753573A
MALRIGVGLPTTRLGAEGGRDVRAAARHAEDLGLESVWAADHLIPAVPIVESTVALAAAAGATERVRLGFSVMILALRPLAWAAKQIGALQHVSGDRVLLGVGVSGPPHGTAAWEAVGVPYTGRGARTDAALAVLPDLLAGRPTALDSEAGRPEVTLAPAASMPPVLIGGNGAVALRRAARFGDGWFPSAITPADLAAGLAELRSRAAGLGRPAPSVTVGVPTSFQADGTARRALIEGLAQGYGIPAERAATIPVTGDPDEAAETLTAYAKAGADRVVLMASGPDWRRHYELAAATSAILQR